MDSSPRTTQSEQALHGPSSLSTCEEKCATQQSDLVNCVKQMQNQVHDNGYASVQQMENPCLKTAVAGWTECCTQVNLSRNGGI
mmetsp:Transcript_1598/g.2338  ORF Transcript_1598/g.2338 Transcript_1598/m.2338 type:complete len:84 (-) Transcript_1598:594-845(-)|eukprot:CAMPEP_0116005980 /NCGR_PEP_ID=MMETSP0321-20121206/1468_1 /TAXON_ID=163516 /ORGANISM="Leptocylindrus danicus var. danicus, Strain B650" /LENGTH=83 /DNA_ID=CAMNT_0003474471 /DNA_START=179 /DNA_END=430 /DNA_ORIENTATION=-